MWDESYRDWDFRDDRKRIAGPQTRPETFAEPRCTTGAVFIDAHQGVVDLARQVPGVRPFQWSSTVVAPQIYDWGSRKEQQKLLREEVARTLRELYFTRGFVRPAMARHIRAMIEMIGVNTESPVLQFRASILDIYAKEVRAFGLVVLSMYLKSVAIQLVTIDRLFKC